MLGTWDGSSPTTTFLLTDSLGSVVSSFNNPASGAVMQGNQLYGPYGNQRLKQGSLSTNKGFTGQYNDGLTGLDYYGARYYDPTIGLFLSADAVQGNAGGMDPYSYVGGNPESRTDPTGRWIWGAAAVTVGLVALGIVAAAAVGIIASPLLVAAAGGALVAFCLAAVIGASNGSFTTGDNFDNWGVRTLISEGIGAATSAFAAAAGNVVQGFAENINTGSTWGKLGSVVNINPAQSASANQAGQSLGASITGMVTYPVDVSHIHAPGISTGPKHLTQPKAVAVPRSSVMNQKPVYYSSYSSYTYSYSYSVYSYAINSLTYHTSVFSASNGYYEISNGRSHIR